MLNIYNGFLDYRMSKKQVKASGFSLFGLQFMLNLVRKCRNTRRGGCDDANLVANLWHTL